MNGQVPEEPGITVPLPPLYSLVGRQRRMHMVVIPESVLADDEALWKIADQLAESSPTMQIMFWTDRAEAAQTLPLTEDQEKALGATITINDDTGLRELTRN